MSNQLSVQAGRSLLGSGISTAPARPAASVQQQATPAKPVPLFVNPSFRFDVGVSLVVIEFHDNSGAVSNSIPSQKQLSAYRKHQATPPGAQQAPQAPKTPQPADGKTSAG
jgi:hypothetical protein